jgi:hypothetical protein
VVAVLVMSPGAALAKGPMDATVDGPGLAEPLTLDWDANETELDALITATGFWELAEPAAAQPSKDLGARYVVSYSVYDDDGSGTALALHAYPFAKPTPLVYVPAGQDAFPVGVVPEGWRTASAALTTWFKAQPIKAVAETAAAADAPAVQPAAAVAPASPDEATSPLLVLAIAGAGALVAAGLVVLAARRRGASPEHQTVVG